jgi:hypothetical protein
VQARRSGKTWVASLLPGERVLIAAGGVRDAFGETNGKAVTARGAATGAAPSKTKS